MKKTLPNDTVEFLTRRNQVFRELANESDRGVVLVGATVLEENLELVLRSVMKGHGEKALNDVVAPLFQGAGAFATFSAKIKCCYAFNLIDETAFKDLETIREIRNEFAHSYQTASFLSQSIKNKIANLSSGKVIEDKLTSPDMEIDVILEEGKPGIKMSVTKRRFVMSVAFLSSYFEAHIVEFRNLRDRMK